MKKQPAVQNEKEIQKNRKNIELKGLLFIAAGLFLLASYAGLPTGFAGEFLHDVMAYGFGLGAIVFPFIFIAVGIGYFRLKKNLVRFGGFWAAMLFYVCLLGFLHHVFIPLGYETEPSFLPQGGGLIGGLLSKALHAVAGATGAVILLVAGMLAGLVLTGKLSVAALTAKAGDKIQDIRSARRERRNAENDSEDTGRYVPRKQEPRPFFSGADPEERKSSPLDVYNKEEFADFNDDVRKPSAFKKILNFGQKALDRNTEGTDPDARPGETGSGNYVPVERMANHDKTEKERPSLIKIYPEQQETRVLRPASGIITGHTDNPEPAPWEKSAIIPGQEFQEPSVAGYGEEPEGMSAGTDGDHEALAPEDMAPGKPRFILTPNGVTQATDGSAKPADKKEKVSKKSTAGSASGEEKETSPSVEEKETEQNKEEYIFPPLDLLNPVKKTNRRQFDSDVREQCRKLEQTLADFRVNAKVTGVTRGPSVTRYELEPAPGVKVSSVVNLADDIALRLAAPGVRVEAPIPG